VTTDFVHQHRDSPPPQVRHRGLTPGGISLAPTSPAMFEDAVSHGGGHLVELGPETKGLVWLSEKNADELMDILTQYPQIDWVQLPWAGVDAFASVLSALALMPENERPVVTSAKGAYSEPVAEHALALLLGCLRELPSKSRDARWQPSRTGLSLFERHIVLIGAGGVSRAFLDVVKPLRPRITVVRRQAGDVEGADRTIVPSELASVLPTADAVVVAAAATESTKHLIGAEELALMPDHAVLVNIARGSLVDIEAVVDAVSSGRLFGAGLDVMDPEPFPDDHRVWEQSRIVITSHSADTPEMTEPLLATRVRNNVEAFLAGSLLFGVVDPEAGY
jgi:phosphoglycerate dehydrogenase-like enzyme